MPLGVEVGLGLA